MPFNGHKKLFAALVDVRSVAGHTQNAPTGQHLIAQGNALGMGDILSPLRYESGKAERPLRGVSALCELLY